MSQPNAALPREETDQTPVESSDKPPASQTAELTALLARAAEHAAAIGIDSRTFTRAARAAFLDARPGLRQELADKQLRSELRKLRKRGLIGSA